MVIAKQVENSMDEKACNLHLQAAISCLRLPEGGLDRNDHVAQQVWIDSGIWPASHREGQDIGWIVARQVVLV